MRDKPQQQAIALVALGDYALTWGEGLLWDDSRERLYFLDCSTAKLYWIDFEPSSRHCLDLPSMATGIGLVEDGRLVVALAEGLYLLAPDSQTYELLANYPRSLGKRANDLTVDATGTLITGSLNAPGDGSYWWFSSSDGWAMIDSGISNTNGPVAFATEAGNALVIADTPAQKLYAYDYDEQQIVTSERRLFADTTNLAGFPDGACATSEGGVLSCLLSTGLLAYYIGEEMRTMAVDMAQPTDVCFGGPKLDRLFVTSIGVESQYGAPGSGLAGSLVEIEGSGLLGVPENRFRLS